MGQQMTVLVELLDRWQAVKRETMDGTEDPDQLIRGDGAGYLAAAAGLDEGELAALQEIVEPQLGGLLLASMEAAADAMDAYVVLDQSIVNAMAETAAAYYIEAIMFGHWARGQAAPRIDP